LHLQLLIRAAQRTQEAALPRDHLVAKLTTCNRQIEKLTALIDQFLDVSQINRDHLVLIRERCDLSALVRQVVARCGREIEASGAVLSLQLDPDTFALVDRQRIDQVLSNLLSNAVKYGGGSPIDVRLQRTGDSAMITVSDRGLGISPEAQERLFQKFERGSQRESVSGLGLGLFMSREIIAAHRGQISVESERGKGATFKIQLALLR
jgi:signal transduction histidine kinase